MPSNICDRRCAVQSWRSESEGDGTDVFSLELEPVEGLFRAVGAVAWDGVGLAELRVCATAAGNLGLCEGDIRGRAGHIASKAIHVV